MFGRIYLQIVSPEPAIHVDHQIVSTWLRSLHLDRDRVAIAAKHDASIGKRQLSVNPLDILF
ncbi:hypothetical protein AQ910_29195 [Burkholderia pseudomallei]|nr:hypothetical protein AQ910_29195 [Burkholderia pseudomallei]ONC15333.1 hypothetical protein AQ911_29855 [Burkholderia pseudomallei]